MLRMNRIRLTLEQRGVGTRPPAQWRSPRTAVSPHMRWLPASALTLSNRGGTCAGLLTPCTSNHVVHGQRLGVCSELGLGCWAPCIRTNCRQIRPPVGNRTSEESPGRFTFELGIDKNLLNKNKEGERWTCLQTCGVSSTRALEPARELCGCSRCAAALPLEGLWQKTMCFTTTGKSKSLHSSKDCHEWEER